VSDLLLIILGGVAGFLLSTLLWARCCTGCRLRRFRMMCGED